MFFEPGLGRGLVFIHVILKKKKSICSKKALRNKKWNKCAIDGKDRGKKKYGKTRVSEVERFRLRW